MKGRKEARREGEGRQEELSEKGGRRKEGRRGEGVYLDSLVDSEVNESKLTCYFFFTDNEK